MDAMRTCISALSGYDDALHDRSEACQQRRAVRLLGQLPAIVAGSYHILTKDAAISPDQTKSYTETFLAMLTG
ncbi:UNVERIFIED_CONTAM: citrate synthase, partial [Bacillus subtilis]